MPNNISVNGGGVNGSSPGSITIGPEGDGSINSFAINDVTLDSSGYIVGVAGGTLVSIEQSIVITAAGATLISIEQTQELRISVDGSATLISIEQSVETTASSSTIISFEQIIRDPSFSTFLTRNGWYPMITINGWRVPDEQITGTCRYEHKEANSALFDFSIIPPLGIQDLFLYQGAEVTCDIWTDNGIFRIFTGQIDIPEADVMMERITFRCSDNREERIANGEAGSPSLLGNYSDIIFGNAADTKQEVLDRLTTIPYSLDWDGYGIPRLTSWTPKTSADFTLGDSAVYRTEPSIRIESRAQITNTVNINFKFNYQRFYHKEIGYTWEVPFSNKDFLIYGYSLTPRAMIRAAAQGTGWPLRSSISYTDILADGFYRIGDALVAWTASSVTATIAPQTDALGNNLVDNTGHQLYEAIPTSTTDYSDLYCFGAAFTLTKQWTQNVVEDFTISVVAPQSVARYGEVLNTESYTLTDENFGSDWENAKGWTPPPTGISSQTYYYNDTHSLTDFNIATIVAITKAKTKILNAHRDSRVEFDKFIWPQLDLSHTIELTTGRIQCKGKVASITHTFNVDETQEATTHVELALFRASGSQSESVITPPTRPTDTLTISTGHIGLPSHYGLEPDPSWTGMIGNKYIHVYEEGHLDYRRTNYTESFVIDTPSIEDIYRKTRTLSAAQTYNIAIPPNNLIWTTVGK